MTSRHQFHQELARLKTDILKMADLVESALQRAVEALANQDTALAQAVIAGDDDIDALEHDIEDRCLQLLALQQPMAVDLRFIGTGLKMITDLERMGDHAVNIAKSTLRLAGRPYLKPLIDIPRMAAEAREMLREAIAAFVEGDIELARKAAERDHRLDQLYGQIFRELLTFMMEDPRTIEQATQLLVVAGRLERVGDHITNLAEWTVYMVTGERQELNT